MSTLTRFHLADELRRHRADWEVKGKKTGESESNNRVPVDLSFKTKDGSYTVLIRIRESIPTDSFELGFKKMVEVINPTNGRKEYVAEPE